jgi:hypothetical protein
MTAIKERMMVKLRSLQQQRCRNLQPPSPKVRSNGKLSFMIPFRPDKIELNLPVQALEQSECPCCTSSRTKWMSLPVQALEQSECPCLYKL